MVCQEVIRATKKFFFNKAVINLLILKINQNDKEIVWRTGILQI